MPFADPLAVPVQAKFPVPLLPVTWMLPLVPPQVDGLDTVPAEIVGTVLIVATTAVRLEVHPPFVTST